MKKKKLRVLTVKTLRKVASACGVQLGSALRKKKMVTLLAASRKVTKSLAAKASRPAPPPVSVPRVVASSAVKAARSVRAPTSGQRSGKGRGITPRRKTEALRRSRAVSATRHRKIPKRAVRAEAVEALPVPIAEHKYELPKHPMPKVERSPHDDLGELPEAYGSGWLFLTARDPRHLYAYWDFTGQQMHDLSRAARHGELKLRVHAGRDDHAPVCGEFTLGPGVRNWFVPVNVPDADYFAEFGYYDHEGCFVQASRSAAVHTPTEHPSARDEARFVTIPFHLSLSHLMALVREYLLPGEELADALHRLQAAGFPFPFEYGREGAWGEDQERRMRAFLGQERTHRMRVGSAEVAERFREGSGGEKAPSPWVSPTASGTHNLGR